MNLTFEMGVAPGLGLEVSPALVAFGELLLLPYPAMRDVIDAEVGDNPALERDEDAGCPFCRSGPRMRCPLCRPPARKRGEPGFDVLAEVPAAESDVDVLLRAVRLETPTADAPVVEHVIGSLDRHGLLGRSPAEIAADLGVARERVERVLDVVRSVGPPGVGATSAAECLLLQLDACGVEGPCADLARVVLARHLPALAKGHLAVIAEQVGVTRAQVRDVVDLVRLRLRPHPAFHGTGSVDPPRIVPDLIIRFDGDDPAVELVERSLTRLTVRTGAGDGSVAGARAFCAQLRDRWQTLWRVGDLVARRQRSSCATGRPPSSR